MDKQRNEDWRFKADEVNSSYASEVYGDCMYQTDPVVEECKKDPIELPSTQTSDDTRQWCLEHET